MRNSILNSTCIFFSLLKCQGHRCIADVETVARKTSFLKWKKNWSRSGERALTMGGVFGGDFKRIASGTHSSSVRMFRARAETRAGARCRARTLMHGLLVLVVLSVAVAG